MKSNEFPLSVWSRTLGWHLLAVALAGAFLFAAALTLQAARPKIVLRPLMPVSSCTYVRETADQAWRLRFKGPVAVAPGIGVLVHDARGKLLVHALVPVGAYSDEQPHVIEVAADGVAGDYRIVLSSHRDNLFSQVTPITDLALEVYAGPSVAVAHYTPPMHFMTPPQADTITVSSRMKALDIRAADQAVPAMGQPVADDAEWKIPVKVTAGVKYWIKPAGSMGFYPNAYFAYDPQRLFVPDLQFDDLKWWRLFRAEP